MTHWRDAQDQLRKLFDHERVGLITDMDGTISPIVPIPDDAAPTERNRDLLEQLNDALTLVAVVSGRAAADVYQRVNLPELVYAGNHGLERWQDGEVVAAPEAEHYRPNLQAAVDQLEPQLLDSMWIEDKQATLSIHYRNTDNSQQTASDFKPIIETIAEDNNLRVFQGRMIFELRPPLDVDKGTIFKQLVEAHQLDAALYIGDDTTDADALKMAQQLRADAACYSLAIGVTGDDTPSAVLESSDLLVSGVEDVEDFFAWLLEAANASSS